MKSSSGSAIICTCVILFLLTGIVAAISPEYDKVISIHMNIDNGKILVKSVEMHYGSAPDLFPTDQGFRGELVAADGRIVKSFMVFDPRVQFGDTIVGGPDSPRIVGVVERRNSVDFVVTVPFFSGVTEFRIYNVQEGTLISSVNLKPRIDAFFSVYPNDPDNPAFSGNGAPAIADTSPTIAQDPQTTSPGQIVGLQVIGAGALLLLGGAFASVRFLRKKPKHVLIVDDNRDIIVVISGMLKKGGYVTRAAASGEECLRDLESAVPDLILLDIGMEPMNGWETLRRIKKNPQTKSIPVIMLTALKLTPKDVLDYGIFIEDYVMKPVTQQGLSDAIMHVFARRQLIEEQIAAAKSAGIDRDELCEHARLTRIVDVNKRLWDLLVRTYKREEGMMQGAEDEITRAIMNIEGTFRDQEKRLGEIQHRKGVGTRS